MEENKKKMDPELKEIIIYRILSSKLPENIKLSIGGLSEEPMSSNELVEHVKAEDEIGQIILDMELNYLKALKEGIVPNV